VVLDDLRKLVRLYLVVHVVEQLPCTVDIVQLDARYSLEVERLNLLLAALRQLFCSFDPRRRLLWLKVLGWSRIHLGHEKLFNPSAVLLDSLVDGLHDERQKSLPASLHKPTLARLVKNRASWYSSDHSKSCKKVIGLRKESKRSTIEELNPSGPSSDSNFA